MCPASLLRSRCTAWAVPAQVGASPTRRTVCWSGLGSLVRLNPQGWALLGSGFFFTALGQSRYLWAGLRVRLLGSRPAFLLYLFTFNLPAAPEPGGLCENVRIYPRCLLCLFISEPPSPVVHRPTCPVLAEAEQPPEAAPALSSTATSGPSASCLISLSAPGLLARGERGGSPAKAGGGGRCASPCLTFQTIWGSPSPLLSSASGTSCVCPMHTCVSVSVSVWGVVRS